MTERMVLKLAAKLSAQYLRGYERWQSECKSYRAEGFRPRYCEHGTSNWTDYDNICGPCEDGHTMSDGVFRRQCALANAHERYAEAMRLMQASEAMHDNGVEYDRDALWDRVGKLMMLL